MVTSRQLFLAAALAALASAPGAAMGQNVHISRLYEQVLENLEFANPGHVLESFGVLRLDDGRSGRIDLDLPADASVQIMGDCDEDCTDLDLIVYDSAGTMLAEDRLADFYPIVSFVSGSDGRAIVEIDLVACDTPYCYAAYSVFVAEAQ